MCGIFALVQSNSSRRPTAPIVTGTKIVSHRGPDDEGYLLWDRARGLRAYAGSDTREESRRSHRLDELPAITEWQVGLGHRRLSIVDLSPNGHQPMVHAETGLTVIYNGEIYNHVELRSELAALGHRFASHCDTEVLLAAWAEWGAEALHRFNGMFAFVLLDPRGGGTLHAVRDRFGVKPLYWAQVGDLLAFASEIKSLRSLPGFVPDLDESTVRDYLVDSVLDATQHTFDRGVLQLRGGERAEVALGAGETLPRVRRWYELRPRRFSGSLAAAAGEFRDLLRDSVRLRLRADVPVGSCLSGGLDSSAIVCLARECLEEQTGHAGQMTVTARFDIQRFDEWRFAEDVIRQTDARSVEVWPTVERLQAELESQLWMMDEPFGSTSQFSQWCVFAGAADAGLKVMLDGQGSDEQLAGYGGNDSALYTGMLRGGRFWSLAREVASFRGRHAVLPVAQLILAARNIAPQVDRFLPDRVRLATGAPEWLALDAASHLSDEAPRDLNDSLVRQTISTSLPVLLRYEDRNSMARSIESRVPFLDYRLVEFLAGLPDEMKMRNGTTKVVLREGLRGTIPESVRTRRDKMGFVTPEEVWLKESATEWFRDGIHAAVDWAPELFRRDRVSRMFEDMVAGRTPFSFLPWRILCLGRWLSTTHAAAPDARLVDAANC